MALSVIAVLAAASPIAARGAPSVRGGESLWTARYNGTGHDYDAAYSLGVSPDGAAVYVTGQSLGPQTGYDFATIAYEPSTGRRLWLARYNGSGNTSDIPTRLRLSPNGSRIFVTGYSYLTNARFSTVAYDASTGAQIWAATYSGPGKNDYPWSLAVSPDGTRVFVTGGSSGSELGSAQYATVAYDAATGDELWVGTYHGPLAGGDGARDVGVSPDGAMVFVTGLSTAPEWFDYATVAYDASTGDELWATRYDGPGRGYDEADSLAVAADGSAVFVAGRSFGTSDDYATIAYDPQSGAELWVARYDGPGHGIDIVTGAVPSPDSGRVFVTGWSYASGEANDDYATIAYDAATGLEEWTARFTPGIGTAEAVAVSPDGTRIYVTGADFGQGRDDDYATVAYDAATGDELWEAHYHGRPTYDDAKDVSVSPDGRTVFVTGTSQDQTHNYDYATVAYSG